MYRIRRFVRLAKRIGVLQAIRFALNYLSKADTPPQQKLESEIKDLNFHHNLESIRNFLEPKFKFRVKKHSKYDFSFVIPEIREEIFYGGYLAFLGFLNKARLEGLNCRIVLFNQDVNSAIGEVKKIRQKDSSTIFDALDDTDFDSFFNNIIDFNETEMVLGYNAQIMYFLDELSQIRQKRNIFLFQEDERIFFPNGSIRMLVEETYRRDFFPIYSSPLLKSEIEAVFPERLANTSLSSSFVNPIIIEVPQNTTPIGSKKRLIIYARPEAHASRNLTELAFLGALEFMQSLPRSERKNWEIIGVGGNYKGQIKLSHEISVNMLGKLTLSEYALELSRSTLGLSLMYAPHPSIPPFEFVSFGVPTVTNILGYRTQDSYIEVSNLFFPCRNSVTDISQQLNLALKFSGTPKVPVFHKSYSEALSHIDFNVIDRLLSYDVE